MYSVEVHQGGSVGWLTGAIQPGTGNLPKSPSIDQVLTSRLSANKAFASLEFAVRWATGKSHGKIDPINAMFFQAASPYAPIPPRLDPQDIFTTLFGSLTGGTTTPDANAIALMRKKSVLDFVDKKYAGLMTSLGTDDRARLDQHLTQVRDLERRIAITTTPPPSAVCNSRRRSTRPVTTRRAAQLGRRRHHQGHRDRHEDPARRSVHDGHDGDGARV